jgi:hypothetical protein
LGRYYTPEHVMRAKAVLGRLLENAGKITPPAFLKAVEEDKPIIDNPFKDFKDNPETARKFTEMMHGNSMAQALTWPHYIDLASHDTLLDIAGGSGAHTYGALETYPNLRGIVLEQEVITPFTKDYLFQLGMADRANVYSADMWTDPYPKAGAHLLSNVIHDHPRGRVINLVQKSRESLPENGQIIIHEMLYNDDKTGPLATAGMDATMVIYQYGQQYSGKEVRKMLKSNGFTDVYQRQTSPMYSIVVGTRT